MKHSHFKHIILAALLAIIIVPISLTQVTINDNRRPQPEPEKKVETTDNGGESANKEGGNKEATSSENQSNNANKSASSRSNNSSVNAADNANNYVDPKKPDSPNQDYSTGSNSSNLQSHQEVEMRSYGYRILVYYTNKSKNAKANAQKRAKDITMKFPQYQFYFTYKAPTWRLRVGDFVDEESAHRALKQLRQAFPMYSKEMTIIHDNINVWK
jgi:hypothetical protein